MAILPKNDHRIPLYLLVTLMVLVGCQFSNPSRNPQETPPLQALSPTVALPTMATPTFHLPIPTATKISDVTKTPTITPPPTVIWSPYPTLIPDKAEEKVLELLSTNGGCKFPCWWGITPGVTTKVDAIQFLSAFTDLQEMWGVPGDYHDIHIQPGDPVDNDFTSGYFIYGDYVSIDLFFHNDIVDTISAYHGGGTGAQRVTRFQLSQFLTENGIPEEIWLVAAPGSPEGNVADIILFYEVKSIFVHYSYHNINISNDKLHICPQGIGPEELTMWATTFHHYSSLAEYFSQHSMPIPSLKSSTGMDLEDFYDRFKKVNTNDCFDTPVSIWEYPQQTPTP